MNQPVDTVIIGGGINGCGCAADAAMRGLSVVLVEQGDIASQTSSSSTKLIHGGLRYLEHYRFNLVRKALSERQILLEIAPHLVHPLQFILPQPKRLRAPFTVRVGLFIYDHLSRLNRLPSSKAISRSTDPHHFSPLIPSIEHGFTYYDCQTDDARLTIANALQAKHHGARILTHTQVTHAASRDNQWHLTLTHDNQTTEYLTAKTVINATGPWVESVNQQLNIPNQHPITPIKGSHIVIKKLYEGEQAYVLQHTDKRLIFTIPYFGQTLIGTTDIAWTGPLDHLKIEPDEIHYLLSIVSNYFNQKPSAKDILTSWSGVRPLIATPHQSASSLSRDYVYHFSRQPAPCVAIYGGKITTYRRLAQEAIDSLLPCFPDLPRSNTHLVPLPGSCNGSQPFSHFITEVKNRYPWLDQALLNHYLATYGTNMTQLLQGAHSLSDLGKPFSSLLYQREVDYLIANEWALTADDILWRRTKLGLQMTPQEQEDLHHYLKCKTNQQHHTHSNGRGKSANV